MATRPTGFVERRPDCGPAIPVSLRVQSAPRTLRQARAISVAEDSLTADADFNSRRRCLARLEYGSSDPKYQFDAPAISVRMLLMSPPGAGLNYGQRLFSGGQDSGDPAGSFRGFSDVPSLFRSQQFSAQELGLRCPGGLQGA